MKDHESKNASLLKCYSFLYVTTLSLKLNVLPVVPACVCIVIDVGYVYINVSVFNPDTRINASHQQNFRILQAKIL